MGGHGALVLALRNPGRYRSVSAFSPIVAPVAGAVGREGLCRLPGRGPQRLAAVGACALIASAQERLPLLVDQGEADEFLATQLRPELLQAACSAAGHPLTLRLQPGLRPQLLLHRQLHRRASWNSWWRSRARMVSAHTNTARKP
jgi:S-formylglutathione hydrolase